MNIPHGITETQSSERLWSGSLTEQIIGTAIEVHRHRGPSLLESVYEECWCEELCLGGIPFRCPSDLSFADEVLNFNVAVLHRGILRRVL